MSNDWNEDIEEPEIKHPTKFHRVIFHSGMLHIETTEGSLSDAVKCMAEYFEVFLEKGDKIEEIISKYMMKEQEDKKQKKKKKTAHEVDGGIEEESGANEDDEDVRKESDLGLDKLKEPKSPSYIG